MQATAANRQTADGSLSSCGLPRRRKAGSSTVEMLRGGSRQPQRRTIVEFRRLSWGTRGAIQNRRHEPDPRGGVVRAHSRTGRWAERARRLRSHDLQRAIRSSGLNRVRPDCRSLRRMRRYEGSCRGMRIGRCRVRSATRYFEPFGGQVPAGNRFGHAPGRFSCSPSGGVKCSNRIDNSPDSLDTPCHASYSKLRSLGSSFLPPRNPSPPTSRRFEPEISSSSADRSRSSRDGCSHRGPCRR